MNRVAGKFAFTFFDNFTDFQCAIRKESDPLGVTATNWEEMINDYRSLIKKLPRIQYLRENLLVQVTYAIDLISVNALSCMQLITSIG